MTEDNSTPLLTALIIHYQNGATIFETIDSILAQDYPRIELVVSDDDSDNFDIQKVRDYIESNKGDNIEQVVVRRNDHNLGMVAHLEAVHQITSGDIELLIAADDCWRDPHVFSDFAQAFADLGSNAEFVTSQIEICDEHLNSTGDLFITPYIRLLLQNEDMESLLNELALSCVLPGSGSAFRRSYFEKIGSLADDYTIVEDWSAYLRWLRMGYKIYYIDRVTLKHRYGGISHSASTSWLSHCEHYFEDMMQVFKKEIEPYRDLFDPSIYEKAYSFYVWNRARRLSLDNTVSVLMVFNGSDSFATEALKSVLNQHCTNIELIVGCSPGDVELLIDSTNEKYLTSSSLNRIRLVERNFGEPNASLLKRLTGYASSPLRIEIPSGMKLSSKNSAQAFLSKNLTGEVFSWAPKTIVSYAKGKAKRKKGGKLRAIKRKLACSRRLKDFSRFNSIKTDLLYIFLLLVSIYLLKVSGFDGSGLLLGLVLLLLMISVLLVTFRLIAFIVRKVFE